ncbi:hypothetical protein WA026_011439 [Henosepilachna vigintioctopunctata]|uniref:ATP-dependent NAD(P)H-hydrate dehydratase n=1 Tax=Henosepilachna vigintioctopunctata TaxID=420089 RepID=A0AAW1TRS4_9CUCU
MKDAATVIKSYIPELIVPPYLDHEQAETKIELWLEQLHVVLIGPALGRDCATIKFKGPADIIFDEKLEVKVVNVGSGRRSGGQGDVLVGSVATFLTLSLQNNACDECQDDRAILAAFAESRLVHECNRLAFSKFGRSMTALDMTHEVHTVFD